MRINIGWYDNEDGKVFGENACYNIWNWHNKESHKDNHSTNKNIIDTAFLSM